jgi:hypothetical protein
MENSSTDSDPPPPTTLGYSLEGMPPPKKESSSHESSRIKSTERVGRQTTSGSGGSEELKSEELESVEAAESVEPESEEAAESVEAKSVELEGLEPISKPPWAKALGAATLSTVGLTLLGVVVGASAGVPTGQLPLALGFGTLGAAVAGSSIGLCLTVAILSGKLWASPPSRPASQATDHAAGTRAAAG